jgi:cell wall-associated NlpC family hydrolase
MFGSTITKSRVQGKAKQYPYWYTDRKIASIFAPLYGSNPPVWGFDCIGLIKAVLWGWNGDESKVYGGAVYASNGVPDLSADAMIGRCTSVSSDMNNIAVGEFLWMKGHCGVYIGNSKVVESSPKWANGVQITALTARNWLKHGRLPYIVYSVEGVRDVVNIELSVLRQGSKGEQVKTLQRLLNAFGYNLIIDGDFGSKTKSALESYQKSKNLVIDGICGIKSWESLLK